jgi:hypothetical protein
MKRISASEQTREHLRALIEGRLGTPPGRSSLVLLAARLILEEALEGEKFATKLVASATSGRMAKPRAIAMGIALVR